MIVWWLWPVPLHWGHNKEVCKTLYFCYQPHNSMIMWSHTTNWDVLKWSPTNLLRGKILSREVTHPLLSFSKKPSVLKRFLSVIAQVLEAPKFIACWLWRNSRNKIRLCCNKSFSTTFPLAQDINNNRLDSLNFTKLCVGMGHFCHSVSKQLQSLQRDQCDSENITQRMHFTQQTNTQAQLL